MKYGAPIRAVSSPAGIWAGAITVRPSVSATLTSSAPSRTATGTTRECREPTSERARCGAIRPTNPTMKPTLAAAGVITFLFSWNNFLWPKVILVDNAYQTLPMLLSNMRAGYVTDYGSLMLAVLIVSIPTMVVFLLLQRSFAEGVTGAIK